MPKPPVFACSDENLFHRHHSAPTPHSDCALFHGVCENSLHQGGRAQAGIIYVFHRHRGKSKAKVYTGQTLNHSNKQPANKDDKKNNNKKSNNNQQKHTRSARQEASLVICSVRNQQLVFIGDLRQNVTTKLY